MCACRHNFQTGSVMGHGCGLFDRYIIGIIARERVVAQLASPW